MMSDQTVTEIVVASPNHTTLEQAVVAANLAATLNGDGPFTVFAPTDTAFAALPASLRTAAMNDTDLLSSVLTYHAVSGRVTAADLMAQIAAGGGTANLTTVNGATLRATMQGNFVRLTGANGSSAFVETADIGASNGVIHSINGVLLPPM
ncbi:fasciclin domain-containing protein [Aurantiacibacter aquimixticola]|uniref:Fasciclin domain-containing protein n=2 Tax=Aurantiacibacter aquimixticola TaxID=1958945 RepID=A0A419RWG4_9SPHN|nr:fasciclin domain-containing protein [Aurantiacibacter aquimixticola]